MDPIEEFMFECEQDRFREALEAARKNKTKLVFSDNGRKTHYDPDSINLSKIEKIPYDEDDSIE